MVVTVPTALVQFFSTPLMETLFFIPLGLILFDLCFGIAAALRRGTFDLGHVSSFLSKDVLRYMGAVSLVVMAVAFFGTQQAVALSSLLGMGPLALSVTKSLIDNIHEVLVGYPIGEALVVQAAEQLGQRASQGAPTSFPLPVSPPIQQQMRPVTMAMPAMPVIPQAPPETTGGAPTTAIPRQDDEGWLLK